MKTNIKTVFLFVICILILACKNNEPNEPKLEENVVQSVTGPLDCTDSQDWSWNAGTATVIYPRSTYYESAYFEILVKSDGIFIFDYSIESSYNYSFNKYAWLSVAVDERQCFYKEEGRKEEKNVKIGKVSKGQRIRFEGNLYGSSAHVSVYNIRIVAEKENGENPSGWDF